MLLHPPAAVGSPAGANWQADKQLVDRSTLRTVQGQPKGSVEVCMWRQVTGKIGCSVRATSFYDACELECPNASDRGRVKLLYAPRRVRRGGRTTPPLKERRGGQSFPPHQGKVLGYNCPHFQHLGNLCAYGETLCPERWARAMEATDRQPARQTETGNVFGDGGVWARCGGLLSRDMAVGSERIVS